MSKLQSSLGYAHVYASSCIYEAQQAARERLQHEMVVPLCGQQRTGLTGGVVRVRDRLRVLHNRRNVAVSVHVNSENAKLKCQEFYLDVSEKSIERNPFNGTILLNLVVK